MPLVGAAVRHLQHLTAAQLNTRKRQTLGAAHRLSRYQVQTCQPLEDSIRKLPAGLLPASPAVVVAAQQLCCTLLLQAARAEDPAAAAAPPAAVAAVLCWLRRLQAVQPAGPAAAAVQASCSGCPRMAWRRRRRLPGCCLTPAPPRAWDSTARAAARLRTAAGWRLYGISC